MLSTILTIFLCGTSIAQLFCDFYQRNNNSALIHSPDDKNLVIVIDNSYWIVNEVNGKLFFQTEIHNSSDIFNVKMSSLFSINKFASVGPDGQLVKDVVGYFETDPSRRYNPLGWMIFVDNYFIPICNLARLKHKETSKEILCGYYGTNEGINIDDHRQAISFRYSPDWDKSDEYFSVFVKQTYEESEKRYIRKVWTIEARPALHKDPKWPDDEHPDDDNPNGIVFSLRDIKDDMISQYSTSIEQFNDSLQVIGLFLTKEHKLFIIIESDSAIKYCSMTKTTNGCSDQKFEQLIDCSSLKVDNSDTDPDSTSKYVMVALVASFVVLVMLLILAVIMWKMFSKPTPYSGHTSLSSQPTQTFISDSMPSIKTVDSNTGLPIDKTSVTAEESTLRSKQTILSKTNLK